MKLLVFIEHRDKDVMEVVIFGATGMVGQGVLLECIKNEGVAKIVTVGRTATGVRASKVKDVVLKDLTNYSSIEQDLTGLDACFFCLGISSAGMKEKDYKRVTYDIALAAGRVLARLNPGMTFIFVSGAGTDSSEQGSVMWARIKGKTENDLRQLPFRAFYAFRPGVIEPVDGVRSKTTSYRILYAIAKPLLPLLRWLFPNQIINTRELGLAMIAVAKRGAPVKVLETKDIRAAIQ